MIRHYITIASRNFIKYKLQTLISVIGLAIGLVCFTYGMKWLEYETSYDGFYPKSKQMYTLYGINKQPGKKERKLPLVLARKLKQDFPEIKETALVYGNFGSTFKYNDQILEDPEEIFIDNNFFTLFPRKVLSGRQTNLLHSLDEIVITRSFALKYFKSPEDAIGKIMKNSYRETLTIVAVVEDAPANSAFKQDVFELDKFTTEMTDRISEDRQWSQFENEIYLLLEDKASADVFKKKLQTYLEKNNYLNTLTVKMIPLTDMRHTFGSELSFNLSYIRTFAITTILLLLCVFFNFINLLLNRIYQRIKEIRLRNSIGAGKRELIIQLLTELTLQTGIAFVLAFCLLELTSSLFCKTFDTKIADPDFYTSLIIITLVSWGVLIVVSFPLLLRFIRTSSLMLSGGISANRKGSFRKVSMTIQLGICVFFLMSTFIMLRQISLMKHKDLGFQKEGLIHITMDYRDRSGITHELATLPIIDEFVECSIFSITHEPHTQNEVSWEGKPDDFNPNFQVIKAGDKFLDAFKITLLKGNFINEGDSDPEDWTTPGNTAVINEEAARIMGIDNPIGKKISIWNGVIYGDGKRGQKELEIVGIVKDFQAASLRNPILPAIITLDGSKWNSYCYYARVKPENEQAAIKTIRTVFEKHKEEGDTTPKIQTMTDVFNQLNKSEDASLQLFSLLAILCTLISIFGIYSVSSSNIAQRRKEVAVRKVMGASSKTIISMFFKEYLTIVVIANAVALPLAWLFMHGWLEQYPYRISIGLWMYAIVLLATSALIICTVLYQTLKASETNPAEVIKSE